MVQALLLRFDAPLMAFGATLVDNVGATQEHPGRSLLTGLLGNALGWHHRDAEALGALQDRLVFATRQDVPGRVLEDFQTAALGQPHLLDRGWTTRGVLEGREGGSASTGTHIRRRSFLAEAVYTLALTLTPAEPQPDLGALESALRRPERPLFLGRKACIPAAPILLGRVEAPSLLAALAGAPAPRRRLAPPPWRAWWPPEAQVSGDETFATLTATLDVTEDRDWANQIVVGARDLRQGLLRPPGGAP